MELYDDNLIYNITKLVYMLSVSSPQFTNIGDGISLVYPQLVDWDHQGPLVLDTFQNDEAIVELMGLHEGIPSGDHKLGLSIDLDCMTYFGETAPFSSCKNKNKMKNEMSLGEK